MNKWLKMVQVLSAVVVFAGGASLSATPAVAAEQEVQRDCTCYEWIEAIADAQPDCDAISSPTEYFCAWVPACWADDWGHVHYSGHCVSNGPNPCPPPLPQAPCS